MDIAPTLVRQWQTVTLTDDWSGGSEPVWDECDDECEDKCEDMCEDECDYEYVWDMGASLLLPLRWLLL